jgi:putative membrane protein
MGLGLATLAGLWLGPLPGHAAASFSAHMTMHMGVVAVAAPLVALGLAGGRFDPVRRAPDLHHTARHSTGGLVVEQGSFFVCAFLVWIASLGGDPQDRDERSGAGVIALLLTFMHMTLLGALLALASRPLYPGHGEPRAALEDQHLGGAIMLLGAGASYLAGGLWLTSRLLRGRVVAR